MTHDVNEAIFLGQRVLVLGRGRLVKDIPVNMTYPRDLLSRECYNLREEILDFFLEQIKMNKPILGGVR